MSRNFTSKQIEKYKRQKYIAAIEKCTKNLFRIFRDKNSTLENYQKKFTQIKKDLDKFDDIRLNSEYLQKTEEYIEQLFSKTVLNKNFSETDYNEMKDNQLSNLNRLQKIKKRTKYSKDKHKNKIF